jgi:HAE1 family hydrophobic/amphiphilic exporter-1
VSARYEPERASFLVLLKDPDQRGQISGLLEEQEDGLGEAFLYFPDGAPGLSSFTVSLFGTEPGELQSLARRLAEEIRMVPRCRGILFHFKDALPAKVLHVNLQKAMQVSVAPEELLAWMRGALGSPVLDKWTTGLNEMDIVLKVGSTDPGTTSISTLLEQPSPGTSVPLGSFVRVSEKEQTGRIVHIDRARSVQFSVLSEQKHRRSVLAGTERILGSFPFPQGYRGEVGAEVKEQRFLFRALYAGVVLSIVLVFFVLMFQFESLKIAAILLVQIPAAFALPLLLLKVLSWPLSFPVIVGLIMTSGIVVNNGILVFSDVKKARLTVRRVCFSLSKRFRSILVSSVTTIAGIAPLLLTGGANRGVLAPLSATMAMGIAGSVFVLFLTVSIFSERDREDQSPTSPIRR